jgi:plasmid stabilization system protein ParE
MPIYVKWSPRAKFSYFQILNYLEENWTIKEIESFIDRTEEVIVLIKSYHKLYPYSKKSDTYKCVLFKQVSLFYRLKSDSIEILFFWNNKRNPKELTL